MGMGGGSGGSQRTQTYIPARSPQEEELMTLQLAAAKQQESDTAAYRASPDYALDQQISKASKQQLLARVSGESPVVSPEAQKSIDEAFGSTRAQGLEDINTSMREDANARGLNVTDSPVANAKGLALGKFETGLQSAKAQSALNLGQQTSIFASGLNQFEDQLRMQAATNRMSTLSGYSSPMMQYSLGERTAQPSGRGTQSGYFNQYGLQI